MTHHHNPSPPSEVGRDAIWFFGAAWPAAIGFVWLMDFKLGSGVIGGFIGAALGFLSTAIRYWLIQRKNRA